MPHWEEKNVYGTFSNWKKGSSNIEHNYLYTTVEYQN